MIFLGISEDLYDAGVTLCENERVVFASNEERYTRRKNEGGFPHHALASALAFTGIQPADVDAIVYSGHMTPPFVVRLLPWLHYALFDAARRREDTVFKKFLDAATFLLPVSHSREDSFLRLFRGGRCRGRCGARRCRLSNTTMPMRRRRGVFPVFQRLCV